MPLTIDLGQIDLDSTWESIADKPFTSLGQGLVVNNGILTIDETMLGRNLGRNGGDKYKRIGVFLPSIINHYDEANNAYSSTVALDDETFNKMHSGTADIALYIEAELVNPGFIAYFNKSYKADRNTHDGIVRYYIAFSKSLDITIYANPSTKALMITSSENIRNVLESIISEYTVDHTESEKGIYVGIGNGGNTIAQS